MKITAIIQARMGSQRFPKKVLQEINGIPLIGILIKRLSLSTKIDQIILATSDNVLNDPLAEYAEQLNLQVFRGSENDVLERYYLAAKQYKADIIVRITGDCPLIDPLLVDQVIEKYQSDGVDYCSNLGTFLFPDGLDTEVFNFQALETAYNEAKSYREREHVTPFIREHSQFSRTSLSAVEDYSHLRWTVDEKIDYDLIKKIMNYFSPRINFSWQEILNLKEREPNLFLLNSHLIRNEGEIMGSGQKLWKRAKQVIPGGNMLLSKRAEMFLPDHWPAYFSKAKGCKVWDLDGNVYTDMSIMGIGTNILGYGHPEVDEAVRQVLVAGNMSTLNCPEEVYLAERLIELHPWAEMARFSRSGGEANAIAIRIARAATGKDNVAICGYHGWHDWYLSANLSEEDGLSGHLLPGLNPAGVPRQLKDTVYPFHYNEFEELEEIVDKHDIGTIKMEVSRNEGPRNGFLQKVRELSNKRNIVLIFDECTSGFRQANGGLHKVYGVEPDMAMFGKAMGNGYAITAIIGKQEIMEAAQSTFISSTFWTERIGPAAALKSLEVMERLRSWEAISEKGEKIKSRWEALGEKFNMPISISGLSALPTFTFNLENKLGYKTYLTQEMLKQGYLSGTSVYVCIDHTDEILEEYFTKLEPIFSTIADCEKEGDITEFLDGPVCHAGFKRLN